MSAQNIISNSLVEFDAAQPVMISLNKTWITTIKTTNDIQRSKITFKDLNTEEILLETDYEILAIFYEGLNIWSWAWSQPGLKNSENYLAKKILLHSLTLGSDMSYIKLILSTSRGIVEDKTQIAINLAISSGFIKQPYIFPYNHNVEGHNLTYYLILVDKPAIEKYWEKNNKKNYDELIN